MIDRRSLLFGSAATMVGTSLRARSTTDRIALWPDAMPGGAGPVGTERVSAKGALDHIARPSLDVFAPERPNGAAVLVAAGGGYKRIENGSEADPAAHWLASRGITAFVLSYRLPPEGWTEGPIVALQDAQRAIRLIRFNAGRFDLASDRLGVLGFSAGGHLLGLAATWSAFRSYVPVDAADMLTARPSAAALIYPVITLEPPYTHTSTRLSLIGDHPSAAKSAQWSVETHVRRQCPPMFLVQAQDDPISDPANTRIMAEVCERAGVPVEFHRLLSGGHGFGMGRPGSPTEKWPGWYERWLQHNGLLG